jgi:hypothetical protein
LRPFRWDTSIVWANFYLFISHLNLVFTRACSLLDTFLTLLTYCKITAFFTSEALRLVICPWSYFILRVLCSLDWLHLGDNCWWYPISNLLFLRGIVTRSRRVANSYFPFLSKLMCFRVVTELVPIIVATRAYRIWSRAFVKRLSYRLNIRGWNSIFRPFITCFRLILTWASCLPDWRLPFDSNRVIFGIFTKLCSFFVSSWSNIITRWWSTSKRFTRRRWNERLSRPIFQLVFNIGVVTWSWSLTNSWFSFLSEFLSFWTISELTTVVIRPRSQSSTRWSFNTWRLFRLDYNLRHSIFSMPVSLLMPILAWTWSPCDFFVTAHAYFESRLLVLKCLVLPWTDSGFKHDLFPWRWNVSIWSPVFSYWVSPFMSVFTWPWIVILGRVSFCRANLMSSTPLTEFFLLPCTILDLVHLHSWVS